MSRRGSPCLPGWRRAGLTASPGTNVSAWDFGLADRHPSGMHVGSALAPQPGDHILDLCAAPGGKTTHLAEQMGNQGRIVACDVDERRLETLAELCRRMGVTIVTPCLVRNDEPPSGPFD